LATTLAEVVSQETAGALERLSGALVPKLNERLTKFIHMPAGLTAGHEMIGVKDGQLYYLIEPVARMPSTDRRFTMNAASGLPKFDD